MSDVMRFSVAADENYVIALSACVRSIIDNSDDTGEVEIAILSCGISSESQKKLLASWSSERSKTLWVEVDQTGLENLPTKSRASEHLTSATYARLMLPEVLPSDWNRVIYLDTDTITLGSLVELWQYPLADQPFGAVPDPYTPVISSDHGVQGWQRLGLDPNAQYFNAGVLLIDLPKWREQEISERAFEYITTHRDEILLADQDGLNVVANGNFIAMDPMWNVMNYWYEVANDQELRESARSEIWERPRVRHYNGRRKPWTDLSFYHRRNFRPEPFFEILDRTQWRGWRPSL